ncbi:phosphatidylethanolamine-binding protein homolog F40A3.3-like [Sitodiplosis mosellana]|uniref:phosphatidylethanolamine-binding protein homolog F40A3.3-like n=1 Tax=Sitodiplosis mosellana TaxID=263140 RepID=UPI002443EEF1|nr:phosphatidylethanolamine-binding protein homolog F40A3.3-like [Sitodiplosis mosellana]
MQKYQKNPRIKLFSVSYPGDIAVNLGNELKPMQTKDKPEVKWEAEKGAFYTLIKIDLDAPNRKKPIWSEIRHWLVMNIPEVEVEKGDEIVEYIGAGPPPDGGLHRYVFLVFKQPNGRIEHNEPRSTKQQWINRANTSVIEFMRKYKLGDPEYGNFYQGQWDEYSDILKAQLMG